MEERIMKHYINKNILITTNNFFYGVNGGHYRAVWGTLKAIHTTEATLGFTPHRASTNWTLEIGTMMIAGCQVHYIQDCPNEPNLKETQSWSEDYKSPTGTITYVRPSIIYNANVNEWKKE